MNKLTDIVQEIKKLEKVLIDNDINKAKAGVYKYTLENIKLGIAGQYYGNEKKIEDERNVTRNQESNSEDSKQRESGKDGAETTFRDVIRGRQEENRGERKADWQLKKLRVYGERIGVYSNINDIKEISFRKLKGTEAEVFFLKDDEDKTVVIKLIDPIIHLPENEDLENFIDRIELYNKYFPETKLEFNRFTDGGINGTRIVYNQRYIDGEVLKLEDLPPFSSHQEYQKKIKLEDKLIKQVANEMKKRFKAIPVPGKPNTYKNNEVVFRDVHLGNVMKGVDNKLYFVDVDFDKVKVNKSELDLLKKAILEGIIPIERVPEVIEKAWKK